MIKATSALLAALALGACASQVGHHIGGLSEVHARFGESVRNNIAMQTVNPEGSSADVAASAARTAKAVGAYTADNVEKPTAPGTMEIQSGGQASGN
jgi:hypothetical protein